MYCTCTWTNTHTNTNSIWSYIILLKKTVDQCRQNVLRSCEQAISHEESFQELSISVKRVCQLLEQLLQGRSCNLIWPIQTQLRTEHGQLTFACGPRSIPVLVILSLLPLYNKINHNQLLHEKMMINLCSCFDYWLCDIVYLTA